MPKEYTLDLSKDKARNFIRNLNVEDLCFMFIKIVAAFNKKGGIMKSFKIFLCVFVFTVLTTGTAFAGGLWVRDNVGWWYLRGDGKWPVNAWQWIDSNGDGYAECYYFNENGYCILNDFVDGYRLNSDGMWVENGQVVRIYVGDMIDHINNPGHVNISGTLEALSYEDMQNRDKVPAEYRTYQSGYLVLFHFDRTRKINIMSGDGTNCFVQDVQEVYLPGRDDLAGRNGQRVTLSFDFSQAYDPTDLEVPFGRIRAYGVGVVQ